MGNIIFMKNAEEMIKDIAEKINNGKELKIESPTLKDIESLNEFDYIITPGKYFDIKVRKKFRVESFLGFPTVMWEYADGKDGYEIADECMRAIPEAFTAEEALEYINESKED